MDGRDPQIHEFWTSGEDGVTREVHLTAQVDVGTGFVRESATNHLNEIWRRVPMFGRNFINGSVQWLGIPDLLETYGTAYTTILLVPDHSWVDRGCSTNHNWGSKSPHHSKSVSIPWNRPVCIHPVHHRMIFENTCAIVRRFYNNLLRANRLARIQTHTTCRNPIHNQRVWWDDDWDDIWDEPVEYFFCVGFPLVVPVSMTFLFFPSLM